MASLICWLMFEQNCVSRYSKNESNRFEPLIQIANGLSI